MSAPTQAHTKLDQPIEEMEKNPSGSEALKKMIPQLLISVSLFSLAVSYSSLFNSFTASSSSLLYYPSSPNSKFSTATSFCLLSKNFLFLICNGLLVFLSKTSGLIQPPSSAPDLDDLLQLPVADATPPLHRSEPDENSDRHKQISIFIAESEEQGEGEGEAAGLDSDKESCWLFEDDAEQLYGEEDDEDEDEGAEELNQKFEDFIRKMKEEIIVNEARHKVLMLN